MFRAYLLGPLDDKVFDADLPDWVIACGYSQCKTHLGYAVYHSDFHEYHYFLHEALNLRRGDNIWALPSRYERQWAECKKGRGSFKTFTPQGRRLKQPLYMDSLTDLKLRKIAQAMGRHAPGGTDPRTYRPGLKVAYLPLKFKCPVCGYVSELTAPPTPA